MLGEEGGEGLPLIRKKGKEVVRTEGGNGLLSGAQEERVVLL